MLDPQRLVSPPWRVLNWNAEGSLHTPPPPLNLKPQNPCWARLLLRLKGLCGVFPALQRRLADRRGRWAPAASTRGEQTPNRNSPKPAAVVVVVVVVVVIVGGGGGDRRSSSSVPVPFERLAWILVERFLSHSVRLATLSLLRDRARLTDRLNHSVGVYIL